MSVDVKKLCHEVNSFANRAESLRDIMYKYYWWQPHTLQRCVEVITELIYYYTGKGVDIAGELHKIVVKLSGTAYLAELLTARFERLVDICRGYSVKMGKLVGCDGSNDKGINVDDVNDLVSSTLSELNQIDNIITSTLAKITTELSLTLNKIYSYIERCDMDRSREECDKVENIEDVMNDLATAYVHYNIVLGKQNTLYKELRELIEKHKELITKELAKK
jgi:DNA-binding Xre family transcriptional regulator